MKYFDNSIIKITTVWILILSTHSFALSPKANEGKELYLDANCQQCHGLAKNFDVKNYKAKNMSSLKGWVSSCDNALETGWFPEEQANVVHYLNEVHYKHNTK